MANFFAMEERISCLYANGTSPVRGKFLNFVLVTRVVGNWSNDTEWKEWTGHRIQVQGLYGEDTDRNVMGQSMCSRGQRCRQVSKCDLKACKTCVLLLCLSEPTVLSPVFFPTAQSVSMGLLQVLPKVCYYNAFTTVERILVLRVYFITYH